MSEQLKQLDGGVKIGNKFEYFNLGNVTIQSLVKNKIIPKKDYGLYSRKRPDGLLVDRTNKKNPKVIAVVEYKPGERFQKESDIEDAIKQCNNYCQVLGAIFGIATDTNVSIWINPNEEIKENQYEDDFGIKRSYNLIRDEEKQTLSNNFCFHKQKIDEINEDKLQDGVKDTLKIINRILISISDKNSELSDNKLVDPTPLAKSVWQDIYVATGKEPQKCLYNVVELFIFKFLSDLKILQGMYSFDYLIDLINGKQNDDDILKHYAKIIRPKIKKELFPPDVEDGTTIMNGTIFINEKDEPVFEFSGLFRNSIEKYFDFGDLINVEKSFKTKLYETFLKRDSGVKGMGQFFTPRKVVGNIVEMAKVENLKDGSVVCDPFCGVGGFILETIAKRNNKDYQVKNGKIIEKIKYLGFDKGSDEKDSERTIILAKANMLIYLSDIIRHNPTITEGFAEIFNKTFHLKKGILGTLSDVSGKEEDKYDLIITNPPYVTKGSMRLKEEIEKDSEKKEFYMINGTGLESLSVEWIIRKLKNGGKAFIIVPDGILLRKAEKGIRNFILKECIINGIISLPNKTFYNTNQKTFILAITKKDNINNKQELPVFTYMVTDIGEQLNVNRFDTGKSDLEIAKNLFRIFEGNEIFFETNDKKCKIQPIEKFYEKNDWIIDKWWTEEEKINLKIQEEKLLIEFSDFPSLLRNTTNLYENLMKKTKILNVKNNIIYNVFKIGGEDGLFEVKKGSSKYTKSYINENMGDYPVYSSQTSNKGIIGSINSYDFDSECLTWTTDGTYVGTVFYRDNKFSMTSHCGALLLKNEYKGKIYLPYMRIILNQELPNYRVGEGSNKRLGSDRIKDIYVKIPVDKRGIISYDLQKQIADDYERFEELKVDIKTTFGDLINGTIVI